MHEPKSFYINLIAEEYAAPEHKGEENNAAYSVVRIHSVN